jgi:hypothetical protein
MSTPTSRVLTAAVCLLSVFAQAALGETSDARAPRVYRARTNTDPAAARRVALALGENQHVVTRLRTGKTYRGHIVSIAEESLQMRLDRSNATLDIPFTEVTYLEQNLTRRAKIAIVAAAAGAAVLTIFFLWLEYGD